MDPPPFSKDAADGSLHPEKNSLHVFAAICSNSKCKAMIHPENNCLLMRQVFARVTCSSCQEIFMFCTVCVYKRTKTTNCPDSVGVLANARKPYFLDKHLETELHRKGTNFVRDMIKKHQQSSENKNKRKTDARADLSRVLSSYMNETEPDRYVLYEVLNEEPGFYRSVMVASFPREFQSNMERFSERKDFVEDEAIEDFEAAVNFWKLSLAMRKRITEQTYQAYMRGKRHQKLLMQQGSQRQRQIIPPRNFLEANNRYLRQGTSIAMGMPSPVVKRSFGHAMVTLNDCVKHLMASSIEGVEPIPFDWGWDAKSSYEWITETPRAWSLLQQAKESIAQSKKDSQDVLQVLVLPEIQWTDDFEALIVKQGKGSISLRISTIAPRRVARNLPDHSFPVSLGGAKIGNKELLERAFVTEIMELQKAGSKHYRRGHGEVLVYLMPYARLCDQPERRKLLHLMGGNSIYHNRFGVSYPMRLRTDVLRACKDCIESLRKDVLPCCSHCVCWDVISGLDRGTDQLKEKLKSNLPKDYPTEHLHLPSTPEKGRPSYNTSDQPPKHLPFRITPSRLRYSFDLAFHNLECGDWTNAMAESFMSRECFDGHLINKILECGGNARVVREIQEEKSGIKEAAKREAVLLDSKKNPDRYKKPEYPAAWNLSDDLSYFVDVIMHLLFLGVVKATLIEIKEWMKGQDQYKGFKRIANKYNKMLQVLRLQWLPLSLYKTNGKWSGWWSENFLAFSRIMPWFFQDIPDLVSDNFKDSKPPSESPNERKWQKKHYVHWLQERGLKTSAKVADLHERVTLLLAREGGPPNPKKTVAGNKYVPEQVERVLTSLSKMTESVMVDRIEPGKTIPLMELRIKQFLAEFQLLDDQVKKEGELPTIISKYNFACLLNLPRCTEIYGPLRNLWEGQRMGEGSIPEPKKHLKTGQRDGFEVIALNKVFKERAFNIASRTISDPPVQSENRTKAPETWAEFYALRRRNLKRFQNREKLQFALDTDARIISVMIVTGRMASAEHCTMFVLACTYPPADRANEFPNSVAFYHLRDREDQKVKKMGFDYSIFEIDHGFKAEPISLTELEKRLPFVGCYPSFGILVPLMNSGGGRARFHLVDRNRYTQE